MEIYLVRHGRTAQPGTYTGVSDVELSEEGEAQVRHLRSYFRKINLDRVFCSPLARCRRTLQILDIAAHSRVVEELREIDFGFWEGMRIEEITDKYPDQIELWKEQKQAFCFPGGDCVGQFSSRVAGWFDELLSSGAEQVLVVCHGGVIRIGLCHLLGVGLDKLFCFAVEEAAVTKVSYEGGHGRLELLNCRG